MDDIFFKNLPTLDLHGYDRETAKVAIEDFIRDNIHMKNHKVLIIHGKGEGILKNTTKQVLSKNKYVKNSYITYFNDGCTVAKLQFDKVD